MPGDTDPKASLEYTLGQMAGELKGIGREIRDLKKLMECRSADCEKCRDGIDQHFEKNEQYIANRLVQDEGVIKIIQERHTGENAVRSWKDMTLKDLGITIGAGAGLIALAARVYGWFKGGPIP